MTTFARASSLSAGVRPAAVTGAHPEVVGAAYPDLSPFLTALMLRNFATDTWQFRNDGLVSAPGCVIASPTHADGGISDQDYVNSWVRDSALCAQEAAHADLPFARTDLLDNFITFSRTTQVNAAAQNRPGHACFRIDGSVRPWGIQGDGPALRVIAVLDMFDKLSPAGQAAARQLLTDDIDYLLGAYGQPTTNLWEESGGFHFFTRAVQKHSFERVLADHAQRGLVVNEAALQAAVKELGERLEDHWNGADHYRATLLGGGPGGDVDSSTVFGAVYGALDLTAPRLLSTAAVVRAAFSALYPIDAADAGRDLGPMVGRYPEDTYDGDVGQLPNIGHPWPLCTALFAQFHYRLAGMLTRRGTLVVDALSRPFYAGTGVSAGPGQYAAGTPEFTEAVAALEQAGDRMLGAVLYHSDHLELSEQYDRDTGYEKSVRNLTWSYAAFLSAAREKDQI